MSKPYWKQYNWDIWSPKNQPLPVEVDIVYGISICTVCCGRTRDLKSTLAKNILDNADYPNLEFVILNYNSQDDMHKFMTSKRIAPYIESGRVKYLRTCAPNFYRTSHSRNIAFRAASKTIVTNVDADNFTGRGFATYVNRLANLCRRKGIFARGKWRTHGRLGLYKSEFEAFGGYDEDLIGYGWEDISLLMRTMNAGHTLMWWAGTEVDFARRICTPKAMVAANMEHRDWKATEKYNRSVTLDKICRGELVVNSDRVWGSVDDLHLVNLNAQSEK